MKSLLLGAVSACAANKIIISPKQFWSLAVTIAAGLSVTPVAQAADFIWSGGGANTNISTGANWVGGVSPATSEDTLLFDNSANGVGVFTANNDDTGLPLFHKLSFGAGDFTLTGNTLALTQSLTGTGSSEVYDLTLIGVSSGTQMISANMVFQPLNIDRVLSTEIVDLADINVATGATLNLQGNMNASAVSRLNITGGGQVNLSGALTTGDVLSLSYTTTLLSGANGALVGNNPGSTLVLSMADDAMLVLDNGSDANADRLDDSMDVYLDRINTTPFNMQGSQGPAVLKLIGNATQAVAEQAGALRVRSVGFARNDIPSIELTSAGQATSLTFDELSYWGGNIRSTTYSADETIGTFDQVNTTTSGRLDFKATDLGGEQQVFFTTAPTLVDSLLSGVTVNRTEFATYDSVAGVKSATTINSLSGAGAGDNVLAGSNETLSANLNVNSLAVANSSTISASPVPETISLGSGQMLVSGDSTVDANIDFGSSTGRLDLPGSVVFNGALSGAPSGLSVDSGGTITLNNTSTLGSVYFYGNDVTLGVNDALAGSSVQNIGGSLNIGTTTQNVASYNGAGGPLIGTGSLTATAGDLSFLGDFAINADLQAAAGAVRVRSSAMNGDIQASVVEIDYNSVVNGNITAGTLVDLKGSSGLTTVNGVISGTADVTASGGIELTGANTYTGSTTFSAVTSSDSDVQTISGAGSIASSSSIFVGSNSTLQLANTGASVNRIGNAVPLSLSGGTLSLSNTGQLVTEDIGSVSVDLQSRISLSGNSVLSADSLSIGANAGDELLVNVAPGAKLLFGGTLAMVGSSNILDKVYIDKTIGSGSLPAWATYDASNGVKEAVIDNSTPLGSAASDAFIRVTSSNNEALDNNKTIGAVVFDLTEAVEGTGTLTLGTGQMAFYQDANITIENIDFGGANGRITNAGNSVINSNLTGTNGFQKLGTGTIELAGANNFSNSTVSNNGGTLVVTGSLIADRVDGSNAITQKDSGQITAGRINSLLLVNSNFSTASDRTVGGVTVESSSSFTNVSGNTDTVVAVSVNAGGQATNSGNVGFASNAGAFTNTATGTVDGFINSGVFSNSGSISMQSDADTLSNSGTLNNTGSLALSGGSMFNSGTLNNSGTITVDANTIIAGDGSLVQSGGTTVVNGIVGNDIDLNGGILKGAGIIKGSVNNTGGSIQPGNSPGDFTIEGDLIVGTGGSIVMEFGNAAADGLNVLGLFDLQVGSEIVFDLLDGLTVEDVFTPTFDLDNYFSYGSTTSVDPFADIMLMASSDAGNFDLAFDESGNFVNSAPSAVPVPAAVWLFGSGLLGLVGMSRRKKAS